MKTIEVFVKAEIDLFYRRGNYAAKLIYRNNSKLLFGTIDIEDDIYDIENITNKTIIKGIEKALELLNQPCIVQIYYTDSCGYKKDYVKNIEYEFNKSLSRGSHVIRSIQKSTLYQDELHNYICENKPYNNNVQIDTLPNGMYRSLYQGFCEIVFNKYESMDSFKFFIKRYLHCINTNKPVDKFKGVHDQALKYMIETYILGSEKYVDIILENIEKNISGTIIKKQNKVDDSLTPSCNNTFNCSVCKRRYCPL